jgi:hypothetical protein
VLARHESQVLQLAARPGAQGLVLSHLKRDAWDHGATAVTGRLDPSLLPALEAERACFRHGQPWTLSYSRRPEVLRAIERGKAFVSRLDGEWWLSF